MSSTKLIRWSGLVLILGGVGVAVGYIIHPPADTAQYVAYPLWNLSHWLGGIGFLLIPLGLVGLYARQSEKAGLLGLIGFVLTFFGGALSAGATIFISVIFRPIGAARGLDWMEPPNGALFTSFDLRLVAGAESQTFGANPGDLPASHTADHCTNHATDLAGRTSPRRRKAREPV